MSSFSKHNAGCLEYEINKYSLSSVRNNINRIDFASCLMNHHRIISSIYSLDFKKGIF
ncbi:hypothetical protein [Methanobrevibacter sp.]|uniref:hypothetical protein n=1 Tax=Methanobrevibacter sp. TaxID=66852 RepID=UPI0025F5B4BC|nr:hypothetical protein [Methanobrevibacter sp.]MBQ2832240.1 hypothetical protein [Methanobrevibacter sp.]